jgi:retinol dehydrogenase-12
VGKLEGKVVLVTGGGRGIGKGIARGMVAEGASVAIASRQSQTLEQTAAELTAGGASVLAVPADVADEAQVERLFAAVLERFGRLDVLVNNAGALLMDRRESVDGIEMTFALNHLAYFLLTNLLLDRLRQSAPSRIVVVSSDAHRGVTMDFDDLEGRAKYRGFRAYSRSKLANVLFVRELARRLEGTGVTANALHPGFVASGFFSGDGPAWWAMRRLAGLFAVTPERGAETSVYLASSPEVEGVTGLYFVKEKPVEPSSAARDVEAARRLWRVSEEMTGQVASR